ncbi:MAG TPA: hypothetical protein VF556_07485 [Pyrinomonadaceae bacterium]|jgi:hypothetical protein
MKQNIQAVIRSLFTFAFAVFIAGAFVVTAQTAQTGTWKASNRTGKEGTTKQGKIQLNFSRDSDKYRNSSNGSSFDLSELQGLSQAQIDGESAVKFGIVREAGTIEMEGTFSAGKGSGTYRFTPNQSYISAMKSRGFDFESPAAKGDSENRLFAAAMINVTTALADDLLSANFGKLGVDDLFKAAIFKVDSKFMREMKDSGFPNLGMEELVKARIFKIDGEFLRELNSAGFGNEPFENVVKMRIFKITPEFITGVRAEGFQNIGIEDLVKMKIFNINSEFIRQARAEGVPMEVEKLVQKRIGVWGK